ncbi:MAG TPA: PfkB family carbohydrate kinase [Gammaproteobacteria bacterium]|nr:PfkB family carbohydrate kinase [Gammaproteobacteria bacterium]
MASANDEQRDSPRGIAGRPVVFGEVVFDEFDDDVHQPGGAPLNVAWHLHGFGLEPLLLSRVGRDELGGLLLERLTAAGLDTRGIQVDPSRATGRVAVANVDDKSNDKSDDQPRFTIPGNQAYDYIDKAEFPNLAQERLAFLYHGSLATRKAQSAAALRFLRDSGLSTFVDVNLRAPWWTRAAVEQLLRGARWVKLNGTELAELVNGPIRTQLQRAEAVRSQFDLELVVVTYGDQGSLAVTEELSITARPERVPTFVDSVGAGDAFSAVLMLGIARGWPLQLALHRATSFAAAICGIRGALPEDDAIYQRFSRQWRD